MYPALSVLFDESSGPLTGRQRECLEALQRSVERLEALIAATADSGWFEVCGAPCAPVAVALGEVVREVVALRESSGAPGPRVDVRSGPGLSPAYADREDVRQLLGDLIDNACRYTSAEGTITVHLAAGDEAGTVAVTVADDGCGVPARELPRVLEFGFRGAAAVEARQPGLGVGLWVAERLVARNGGRLALTSEPGAGTKATVVLPAVEE
jgi:signal transduction histidine kinase